MNNKKIPEFVPGPPGTGKTHRWLKNSYSEFLQKYPWDRKQCEDEGHSETLLAFSKGRHDCKIRYLPPKICLLFCFG